MRRSIKLEVQGYFLTIFLSSRTFCIPSIHPFKKLFLKISHKFHGCLFLMFTCIEPTEYSNFLIANHLRRRKIRLKMHNWFLRFVMCLGILRMKKRMHMQFIMTWSKILMCVYHVSNVFVIYINCLVLNHTNGSKGGPFCSQSSEVSYGRGGKL